VKLEPSLFQQLVEEYRLAKECLDAQKFVLERLSSIFREFGVASTATNPDECEQPLRAWLGDAETLYRVFTGELKASEFLGATEKLMAPEVFGSIVIDLSTFLAPRLQKLVEELSDSGKRPRNSFSRDCSSAYCIRMLSNTPCEASSRNSQKRVAIRGRTSTPGAGTLRPSSGRFQISRERCRMGTRRRSRASSHTSNANLRKLPAD
jgi:hypothetical protein